MDQGFVDDAPKKIETTGSATQGFGFVAGQVPLHLRVMHQEVTP